MTQQMIQNKKQEVLKNISRFLREQGDYVFLLESLSQGEAELLSILSVSHEDNFASTARALSLYNDILQLIRPLAVIEGQING